MTMKYMIYIVLGILPAEKDNLTTYTCFPPPPKHLTRVLSFFTLIGCSQI